jgi:hypothetical protein
MLISFSKAIFIILQNVCWPSQAYILKLSIHRRGKKKGEKKRGERTDERVTVGGRREEGRKPLLVILKNIPEFSLEPILTRC